MPLSGSQAFIDMLLKRKFSSSIDQVAIMDGKDVNGHNFKSSGFKRPVLVLSKGGLRIQVPPKTFSVNELTNFIEPDTVVDVIDVRNQSEIQMPLHSLIDHFNNFKRPMLLNMLSLEFSRTKLAKLVQPPHVVSELSLVTTCWLEGDLNDLELDDCGLSIPTVQKYCLLSMKGSYTDFHIDFGGSSVWYHVLWGEKIFYLIPPTPENCAAYWRWTMSEKRRTEFFPDLLIKKSKNLDFIPQVYSLQIKGGQTIFLPSGWIHAVYTVSDSLVFGGNFLNELHIPMQLSVYRMEQKCETPQKFLFPNFEKIHWFVSQYIFDRITNNLNNEEEISASDIEAVKCLVKVLPNWYSKRILLTPNERHYYLPDRSNLDCSWTDLIQRLRYIEEICSEKSCEATSSSKQYLTQQKSLPKHSKKQTSQIACEKNPYDVCETNELIAGTSGLGWNPNRHEYLREVRESKQIKLTPEQVIEDPEILDALPSLKKSRLVGDHYYLNLTDSDDEDDKSTKFSKTSTPGTKYQAKDDDPTWIMPSPSRRKQALGINRKSKLSFPSEVARSQSKKSCTTGRKPMHLLLGLEEIPSTSQSSLSSKTGDLKVSSNPNSQIKQKSRAKQTTVRERLAKRLGL